MDQSFADRLQQKTVLIADGATGTNLQRRGLPPGTPPDEWVFLNPKEVVQLHRDFVLAGSDIILTNSFGGTSIRLRESQFQGQTAQLNKQAVLLAKEAAGQSNTLIAGSMGPVGGLLKPLGPLEVAEVIDAYAEQAGALTEAGVNLLVIETQFSLEEAQAAVTGARQVSDLPLIVSFSYDRGVRTMMGVKPAQVVDVFVNLELAAIGSNCGKSLAFMEQVVNEYLSAQPGTVVWAKPNAGMPIPGTSPAEYDTTPQDMAQAILRMVEAGAKIVGGCCGSTPEHIREITSAVRQAISARD